MDGILTASVLGIVEGVTEFLPVSSTGHLILAGHLLGFAGEKAATFDIFIQLGAILAVVVVYWKRFWGLLVPDAQHKFSGLRGIALLMLTSFPACLLGLLVHTYIKAHLFTPQTVAIALFVGAVAMLLLENKGKNREAEYTSIDALTPKLALGIGCFQCLALWPGFSRSAATIMGGMLLGAQRSVAAEYSFIAAVPIMFAATGFDLLKNFKHIGSADISFFAVGFIVAFFSALAAITVFIRLLGKVGLAPFAWYRLALAPVVYFFWPA